MMCVLQILLVVMANQFSRRYLFKPCKFFFTNLEFMDFTTSFLIGQPFLFNHSVYYKRKQAATFTLKPYNC